MKLSLLLKHLWANQLTNMARITGSVGHRWSQILETSGTPLCNDHNATIHNDQWITRGSPGDVEVHFDSWGFSTFFLVAVTFKSGAGFPSSWLSPCLWWVLQRLLTTIVMESNHELLQENSCKVSYIPQTARPLILSSVNSCLGKVKPSWWVLTLSQENPPPSFQPWEFLISQSSVNGRS